MRISSQFVPTHDGGVAVGGKRDGGALSGVANRTAADQLVAVLGPNTAAAGEDPPPQCSRCQKAHPRWRCCRRRTARRTTLVRRFQPRRCPPACSPGSRHHCCGYRPTPPPRSCCRQARPQWQCCRRQKARRTSLARRVQPRRCQPASIPLARTAPTPATSRLDLRPEPDLRPRKMRPANTAAIRTAAQLFASQSDLPQRRQQLKSVKAGEIQPSAYEKLRGFSWPDPPLRNIDARRTRPRHVIIIYREHGPRDQRYD
jgi:hypothetical protein